MLLPPLGRAQESAMRRNRVAPMLKMQSSPTKDRRPAMLGPANMEERGSHRVGTIPVANRIDGLRSHIGHLSVCFCGKMGWLFNSKTASSFWTVESSGLSSASTGSTMLLRFMMLFPSSMGLKGEEASKENNWEQNKGGVLCRCLAIVVL